MEYLDMEASVEGQDDNHDDTFEEVSNSEVEESREDSDSDEVPIIVRTRRRLQYLEDDKQSKSKRPKKSLTKTTKPHGSSNSSTNKRTKPKKNNFRNKDTTTAAESSNGIGIGTSPTSSETAATGTSSTGSSYTDILSNEDFLKKMKKSNELLTTLLKRADSTDSRLKVVEEKLKDASTPTSRRYSRKRIVPDEVRRETRRVYSMLMDQDIDAFPGWKIEPGVTYKDPPNQAILDKLVRKVKGINESFLTQHIKDAAYRFYRSKCEEESRKRRGKHGDKNKSKRKHE